MRIVILPSSYHPVLGGVQTVAHNLAVHFKNMGHKVLVVTNRYPRSLRSSEELDGIPIRRLLFLYPRWQQLKNGRFDLFSAGFFYSPTSFFKLQKLISDFRPDVVNVHYIGDHSLFVHALRRRHRFRLVVSLHGYEVEGFEQSARSDQWLFRSTLREANAVTACSRNLLEKAVRHEPSVAAKGRAIHNGIEIERFETNDRYERPRPYILGVGRLTDQKGFDILIQAFSSVAVKCPNVDLIIAGDGEDNDKLIGQVARLGLNGRVCFFGRASPCEVVVLLNGCEFFVMPSRWEPFGIVALEAMAAGKAVLGTRVGGLGEFVDPEVNKLVEPDSAALAEALADWLSRLEGVKMRGKQNRLIARDYTWAKVASRYLEVCASCCDGCS